MLLFGPFLGAITDLNIGGLVEEEELALFTDTDVDVDGGKDRAEPSTSRVVYCSTELSSKLPSSGKNALSSMVSRNHIFAGSTCRREVYDSDMLEEP